jgi:hypothetical protein
MNKLHILSVYYIALGLVVGGRCRRGRSSPAAAGLSVGLSGRRRLTGNGRVRGQMPLLSGDETRQAAEEHGEDCLVGGARRQVDLELGFQLDDAGGELDQAQPQGVELHDAPS